MTVSSERLSQALTYLAQTDEEFADANVEMQRREYAADKALKRVFLESDGNNEVRKAKAIISEDYDKMMEGYFEAAAEFENMKAKRKTEELIVEVWRSLNANRRQGTIT